MSDHAVTRPETDEEVARPRLIDRLRALFGLGGASIRDDIQDALEDTTSQTTSSRWRCP